MSRHLLCKECFTERLPEGTQMIYSRTAIEPAEYQRLIIGVAKFPTHDQRIILVNNQPVDIPPEHYDCDFCMKQINPGDPCGALSIWTERTGEQPPWEDEYLQKIVDGENRNV